MGNFSKDPQAVLQDNLSRGYVAVHIEQGVPVLDRDLNLVNDLNAAMMRAALAHYIGNGVATGSGGFLIEGTGLDNDFQIDAGQILVNGLEITNASAIKYSSQPGVPALTTAPAPNGRTDTVFLDLSLTEIDGTKDSTLLNNGDVGSQTSVRQQVVPVVRVAENSLLLPPQPAGHTFIFLARLNRSPGTKINAANVQDLRQQGLTLSALEQRMEALEKIHAAAFAASPNQFAPKTSGAGANVTIFGRNFDVGPLSVSFINTATSNRATAVVVGTPLATQATVTVPAGVTGVCKVTVTNPFGSDTSFDNFNVT
jgi:hypothetical protein